MRKFFVLLSVLMALVVVGCDIDVAAPTSSVESGEYSTAQTIVLSSATKNAKIYYTLDYSDPVDNGVLYRNPVTITCRTMVPVITLKVVAKKMGNYSPVLEFTYRILGPAGGYVFYDIDADNDSGNLDGLTSAECGWRFLEASPENLTVGTTSLFPFGYYRESDDGDNLFVNGTKTYEAGTYNATDGKCTGSAIGTGKANTAKLLDKMGDSAYVDWSGTEKTANYAAKVCADYSYGGYDDWFLPSKMELSAMHYNLYGSETGHMVDGLYWTSSEYYLGYTSVWDQTVRFGHGLVQTSTSREKTRLVRAARAFQ